MKEGVEVYKKIITGNAPKKEMIDEKEKNQNQKIVNKDKEKDNNTWKSHFNENPNLIE